MKVQSLGLPIVARLDKYQVTFFSLGNHHDFATAAVGEDAVGPEKRRLDCSMSRSK